MRALLKSTGERGEAWQNDRGAWWFAVDTDAARGLWFRLRRSDLVLLPGSGEGVGR